MCKINTTDFEAANIEYIEFWMLDPFIYNPEASGGDLYLNIGEVSEDVLADGKKFFENGLPVDGDTAKYTSTVWGKVPTTNSLVYAFDNNNADSRYMQDVGLNGLSTEEERTWPAYAEYLTAIKSKVSPEVYNTIYDDPSGDNYHYYRGNDYDNMEMSVLDRYRKYNGTEGNSPNSGAAGGAYDRSSRTTPDYEDANGDFTLDEYEKFFQYRISLRPQDLQTGKNYIADKREVKVKLRNGNTETVNWYCFRIPVREYEKIVGSIRDFSSIRFMRIYLTGFSHDVHVRFGSLELMTSQWRNYEQPIASALNRTPTLSGTFSAASVNIEENGDRTPVNYVVPPGVTRIIDPNQVQLVQDNEQAMSLKVTDLGAGEARGIYKKLSLDLRKYKRIQMFSHIEAAIPDVYGLQDGDLSVFIRLGSDYSGNFYEYEIPLKVTPPGFYSGNNEQQRKIVWPEENMLDIDFEVLTNVKNNRNRERNLGTISTNTIYSEYDPNHPENRISVAGNPSIGNVRAIMIGVRNNSLGNRSAEVWVNELRLVGYESKGGMAAQSRLSLKLSDLGSVDMSGQMATAGYGGLEEGIQQRRTDDFYKYSVTTSFNLGRFLPEATKVSVPVYYSYSEEKVSPQYSPYDTDLYLNDVIETYPEGNARDSLRKISQEMAVSKNFSISNATINISSEKPMPYDPANFSFSYSKSTKDISGSTIDYEYDENWKADIDYSYSPSLKGLQPFSFIKYQSNWLKILKETTLNFLPQQFGFNTALQRNYYELQERDLEGAQSGIPVIFSQQFRWNRDMSVTWNPLKELKLSFSARTQAQIEEPYTVVNRELYPDQYRLWKDSVKTSLMQMGRPLDYNQSFSATYNIPLSKLPILDWTTMDVGFNSRYTWNRGTTYADGSSYGNIISTNRNITVNARLNMTNFYNKTAYLRRVNERYTSRGRSTAAPTASANKNKYLNKEFTFVPDSTFVVEHNLGTLTPKVTATKKDGSTVKLKFKKIDADNISVKVKDTLNVVIRVVQDPDKPAKTANLTLRDGLDFGLRTVMMLRNVSVSYSNTYNMSLPGFMPSTELLGQTRRSGYIAPGMDFAFGLTGDDYLYKAIDRGWLLKNDSIAYSAASTEMQDLQIRAVVEPFVDLRIDLNSNWTKTGSGEIQYMYEGMPRTRSGSFNMSVITLGSAFERHTSANGYRSAKFSKLLDNMETIKGRLEDIYDGAPYPAQSSRRGQTFNKAGDEMDLYSSDVLIPAFLATYTGRNASKSSLDLFPSILSMLPNWNLTYSGLSKLPFFQRYFKSFNLRHAYRSAYAIGSFNTYNSYMEYMNGRGFIEDVTTGSPIPSTMYNIGSVSINESFAPLAGVDMTFNNNITFRLEFRKTRVLTLSTTSVQLVETNSDDITAGAGYKLIGVKLLGSRPGTGRDRVSNDLNMSADFSYRNQNALCRNIMNGTTQATSGNRAIRASFQADYTYSRMLTLNFYYDFQSNFPLVSTAAYPTSTHDCGFTLKFTLSR